MSVARKIPDDIYETPPNEPDRPSGSWPRRIEDRVNGIQSRVDEIHSVVTSLDRTLRGTRDSPFGLVHDVDALKTAEKDRRKWVGAALIATLGAAATTFWNILTTGKNNP